MKHSLLLLFLFFFLISLPGFSQAPPLKINYQGVARSATGIPFASQPINVRFRILQGPGAGTQVFTEDQALTTNALGLFNTQIGNVNTTGLGNIAWSAGTYSLEISLDTAGTGNPQKLALVGTQQLVSVPYSLYSAFSASAASAPPPAVSVNGTVLTIGTTTVPLSGGSSNASLVSSGAATTATLGPNSYSIDVPVPAFTGSGSVVMSGTYPNYTVYAPAGTNASSVVSSGAATTATLGPNSYSIDVPVPAFTSSGSAVMSGAFPNYTVYAPASTNASVVSTGAATTATLGPNSYSINVPLPVFTNSGTAVMSGTYPNYTVYAPAGSNASVVSTGAASTATLGPNSYSINVPLPVFTNSGTAVMSGTYPNYTVYAPAGSNASVVSTGAATTATLGPNSYSINVPLPVFTNSGTAVMSGTYPNYTVYAPAGSNASVVSTGAASTATLGPNSYSINVPVPVFTNSGTAVMSGTYPNYTVYAPAGSNASVVSTGVATTATLGPNSYSIDVPQPVFTSSGSAVMSGAYPNYTVFAPAASNASVVSSGAATTTTLGPNSYSISVPQTSITSSNNTATISAAGTNSFNIIVPPTLTLNTSGGSNLSGAYPNYTITSPQQLNLTTAGATTMGGVYPNINVGSQLVSVSLYNGPPFFPNGGLLSTFGSYPNFSLGVVPQISYSSATGSLVLTNPTTFNTFAYNITPTISRTNNVIQSGPATNTLAITSPASQVFTNLNGGALAVGTTYTQLNSGAMNFTKQVAGSEVDIYVHTEVTSGTFLGSRLNFQIRVDGNASPISSEHFIHAGTEFITLRAVFQGLSAGAHTISIWAVTTSGIALLVQLDPTGTSGTVILKENY